MESINLYKLTRVTSMQSFASFEKLLSRRSEIKITKQHEINSLISFVETISALGMEFDDYNSFYYSYEIPQICKEFDLIRISNDFVINIELKSQDVGIEKIMKQLAQNRQYLSHLSKPVYLYTFVESTKKFFELHDGHLVMCDGNDVVLTIKRQIDCYNQDINALFRVSDFLVSPLNTPQKFLLREYFLTSQQQENKSRILQSMEQEDGTKFYGMTGGPGTGKTLALYDLAYDCSSNSRVCVIHCGILADGHSIIDGFVRNLDIFAIKDYRNIDFHQYKYIFVDECHRIYENQFEDLIKNASNFGLTCVFSYDKRQVLSKSERVRDIAGKIRVLPNFKGFSLTNRIRTNKEIVSFTQRLLDLNSTDVQTNYPSITLAYANKRREAEDFLSEFQRKGYIFINYTSSHYSYCSFDCYSSKKNTHKVIGQEFDKIVMLVDSAFRYSEKGILEAKAHPNPDYIYVQLLFQGLTRAREKLALIVLNNKELFHKILEIIT